MLFEINVGRGKKINTKQKLIQMTNTFNFRIANYWLNPTETYTRKWQACETLAAYTCYFCVHLGGTLLDRSQVQCQVFYQVTFWAKLRLDLSFQTERYVKMHYRKQFHLTNFTLSRAYLVGVMNPSLTVPLLVSPGCKVCLTSFWCPSHSSWSLPCPPPCFLCGK